MIDGLKSEHIGSVSDGVDVWISDAYIIDGWRAGDCPQGAT